MLTRYTSYASVLRRSLLAVAVAGLAMIAAGCGGGGSSYNQDDGFYTDGRGNKTITRTLDNQTRFGIDVTLKINGSEYLDTVHIRPDDYVNITIERMRVEDFVRYEARFDNGDTTSGEFGEDGRTVFTHDDSRAADGAAGGGAGSSIVTTQVNGKSAVKPGGRSIKLDASAHKPAP